MLPNLCGESYGGYELIGDKYMDPLHSLEQLYGLRLVLAKLL